MKLHHHHQHGLALVSAVIVLACILIIGGIAVKVLLNLCKRINPPVAQPGDASTNAPTTSVAGITTEGVWQAPQLRFAPLAAPEGQTAANPFGNAHLEVERSTNLVDWEVIAIFTNVPDVDLMSIDSNRPPDRAFYRGKFCYP